MKEENKKMNIYEKIFEIKKIVKTLKKNADGNKSKYVDEEQILLKVNDKMEKLGLLLEPQIKNGTTKTTIIEVTRNSGKVAKEVLVEQDMIFTWVDINTKEKNSIEWALIGQQENGSQAYGSGLTYANRYFLIKYFNIASTDNDPDELEKKKVEEENKKTISINQTKIKKIIPKLLKIYQSEIKIYEACGYKDKNEFMELYNNPLKVEALLEQMEIILEEATKGE